MHGDDKEAQAHAAYPRRLLFFFAERSGCKGGGSLF
jgi:hypothetical protein